MNKIKKISTINNQLKYIKCIFAHEDLIYSLLRLDSGHFLSGSSD